MTIDFDPLIGQISIFLNETNLMLKVSLNFTFFMILAQYLRNCGQIIVKITKIAHISVRGIQTIDFVQNIRTQ